MDYKVISDNNPTATADNHYSKNKATLKVEARRRVKAGEKWAEVVEATDWQHTVYRYDRLGGRIRFYKA
jgi:hypothetical protein